MTDPGRIYAECLQCCSNYSGHDLVFAEDWADAHADRTGHIVKIGGEE